MNLLLNNRKEEIAGHDQLTVQELLDIRNFTFKFLVVRINGTTVKPDAYASSIIRDGDEVLVLHLISGG
jgi:sulfur carrier protein